MLSSLKDCLKISYKNKRLSLLNASHLLNAPTWAPKIKLTPRAFIGSFTVKGLMMSYTGQGT